ncbi:MAG TPA: glycosyltransferase N-terminal domain-containing protein, partial [Gemmatimonadales bacterium]|nr:glycosyltransferase N-terminal domain-containing protein [Gemmatimonadales bacterium]
MGEALGHRGATPLVGPGDDLPAPEEAGSPGLRWRLRLAAHQAGVVVRLAGGWRSRGRSKGQAYRRMLRTRLGDHPPAAARGGVWIHAPDLGELRVAVLLASRLPPEAPVVVTTFYGGGQRLAVARSLLGDRATVTYLPFTFPDAVRRFAATYAPAQLIQVEGKAWALPVHALLRPRIPAVMVNLFLGNRHLAVLRHPLLRPLLPRLAGFGVQGPAERRELMRLGVAAERIVVTGDLKMDLPPSPPIPELEAALARSAAGRPVLVAGSVHPEELEAVLEAYGAVGGGRRALLLLAPRQPSRSAGWQARAVAAGWRVRRRSRLGEEAGEADVVLLDSQGELAALYRIATAAFVGGSLAPRGGHNVLEPARFAVPIAVGPHTGHLLEVAQRFDRAGAWRRVTDAAGL